MGRVEMRWKMKNWSQKLSDFAMQGSKIDGVDPERGLGLLERHN
jgi:hypothetical protein